MLSSAERCAITASRTWGLNIASKRTLGQVHEMTKQTKLKDNEIGGPLVEESLLLGLAVVTVSIIIAVILEATGWAQGVVNSLLQLLQDSWSSLTQLFGP
ncbi:MAG: hypothetical protein C4K49_04455 [Candidatus Thorarchaeota archaeon]|nr:MAG: hypothetical protein C4K49_04455 [Candidatus Thorarchaeota archaeon]